VTSAEAMPTGDASDRDVQPLPWDSEILGVTVARLAGDVTSTVRFWSAVAAARRLGVELLYWTPTHDREWADDEVVRAGGLLVDERCTYVRACAPAAHESWVEPRGGGVERYSEGWPNETLRRLALASGEHSRFNTDPRVGRVAFERLYDLWIARSVSREIADEVFVARSAREIVGMVTVDASGDTMRIGLLAVAESRRGAGVGRTLVTHALRWGRSRGCTRAEVVTQARNRAATGLYSKCGYTAESKRRVYHVWLR
jgi:dTDP-4-amino-4,6-dideoxy-D-galactose acyltransferase